MSSSSRNPTRTDPRSFVDRARAQVRREELAVARKSGVRLDGSPRKPSGPAPVPEADRFSVRVVCLFTPGLRDEVTDAARKLHVPVGEWLRAAALEKLARG